MYGPLKERLGQAYQILHMEGLAEDTIRGHITVRNVDGRVYIKPWVMGFEEVRAQDLLGVDLEGNLIEGAGRLHSELAIHLGIYRKRKDLFSVVHVHPLYSVVLSSVFDGSMKIIGQNGMHFVGTIPCYPSEELVRTKQQGSELAQIMGDQMVVLMRNHGIVTAGRSLEEAVILAIDFEKAAREHLLASSFGTPTEVSSETAGRMGSRIFDHDQYEMMWDFYARKLQRHQNRKA